LITGIKRENLVLMERAPSAEKRIVALIDQLNEELGISEKESQ